MTTLKTTSKKAQYYMDAFSRAINNGSIFDIYKQPSSRKISIADALERKAKELKCFDIRYLHGTSFNFVMGYSDGKILYIETVSNTFEIEL